MNQKQLQLFLRYSFQLEKYGEDAVKYANPALRDAMLQIRQVVRSILPEENLLRDKALREMMPAFAQILEPYNRQFAESLVGQMTLNTPEMKEEAVEMITRAAPVAPPEVQTGPLAGNVQQALNSKVNNVTIEKLFNVNGDSAISQWTKSNMATIQRTVQKGIIDGTLTEDIAEQIAGTGAERQIRSQARALARTAVQDYNRQVHESVWDANADALEGLEYEYVSALDSRTCPTCAPQDGKQYPRRDQFDVQPPVHVNCRCRLVLTDPEDEDDIRRGIQLQVEKPSKTDKNAYVTPVNAKLKVKGKTEKLYRRTEQLKGPNFSYADYLAGSNEVTQAEFFGGGKRGIERATWFREAAKKMPPGKALQKMVTGEVSDRRFVAQKPKLSLPKKKVVKKKATPKPKPVAKASTPTQAAKPSKQPAKPKFTTKEDNYDYDKNWEKLGYKNKAAYRKVKSDVVEWSGNDFEGVRAAQFDRAGKKGVQLNQYEKLQTRRLESGEARSFGKMADRLEDFVERAPKYDGTLRRGVAFDNKDQVKDLIERYGKGDPNKALESWTSDKRISDRFARGNNNPRSERITILVENNTKGAPINAISGFDDEFEILVPSGVKYEVVEVQETFVKGSGKAGDFNREDHTDWVLRLREVVN